MTGTERLFWESEARHCSLLSESLPAATPSLPTSGGALAGEGGDGGALTYLRMIALVSGAVPRTEWLVRKHDLHGRPAEGTRELQPSSRNFGWMQNSSKWNEIV